jgi:hypothetical protein
MQDIAQLIANYPILEVQSVQYIISMQRGGEVG